MATQFKLSTTGAEDANQGGEICCVDGCAGRRDTRGMCDMHYRRWRRNGTTDRVRIPTESCSVAGCGRKHEARGLCESHYKRWQRHHDPMIRLIRGCEFPGCVRRTDLGNWCAEHAPVTLVGRSTAKSETAAQV